MTRPTDTATSISLAATAVAELYPENISGEEGLNRLAQLTLGGYSAAALTMDAAIASHLTITLRKDGQTRPLDLLCAEIRQLPGDATVDRYSLQLRPWLWWLTLAGNNRIFQAKTVPDIIKAVFAVHSFSDYSLKLDATYQPREYCVQYGESDFDFVSRLMEDEGIFWFYTHEDGKHTLVLADSNDAFPACPNARTINWLGQDLGGRELHGIRSGEFCQQAVSTGYNTSDYEFTTPSTSLYSQTQAKAGSAAVYEHPGGYTAKARGDALGKIRVAGLRSQETRFIGESDCRWLIPGHTFTLSGHDNAAANIEWVVMSVSHDASHQHYRNRFTAIPKATPYRPPRLTPKPRMHTQTALVVGKSGEEIWTDEYGRIKVQFPWDQDGKKDESSSCWVRVMQAWSGKAFGAQFIPRIGQEVVVTFIDGDPDKPLVTGCVYNGENSLPYALPANQTQSGIKTNSSKGGGGFNELRFEDKKDAEEVFLQAQKDLKTNILNDATHTIGHDEIRTVKNDRTRTIEEGNDSTTISKGNRTVTVSKGNETTDIKGNRSIKTGGDETLDVGGNCEQKISGNYTLTIDGNLSIKVSGTVSIQSGGAYTAKSDAALTNQAGTSLTNKAGTALTNQAGTSLDNKAGTTLTNDGGVSLMNKGGAEQTVDGGGMLTIKGGLVKIN